MSKVKTVTMCRQLLIKSLILLIRLNISLTSPKSGRGTPRRTPLRATPLRGTKRKRTDAGSLLQSSASAGFKSESSAKGAVEVNTTDEEGKFIKLVNSSEDKVSHARYRLSTTSVVFFKYF